jgi:hypothetical protein
MPILYQVIIAAGVVAGLAIVLLFLARGDRRSRRRR